MIEFPEQFKQRLLSDNLGDLLEILNSPSPTSIRVNNLKNRELDFDVMPISWCSDGRHIVGQRPKFTLDPLLHAGGYYVQEASSMIVGDIARTFEPKIVLDLCAAPGGKTTHLASIVGSDGVVVANEVIRSRATILAENVQKWGSGNIIVTSCDAKGFGTTNGLFDMIVADVPCSGEGMFRKDVESRALWSEENVALCAARGKRIVSDVWNALQDDGIFIYSTCTFNRAENQDNVKWICDNLGAIIENVSMPQGAVLSEYGANFYPHKIEGEGFFVAVLRKKSTIEHQSYRSSKPLVKIAKSDSIHLNNWVNDELDYRIGGDVIYGYRKEVIKIIDTIIPLGVIYSGVAMGSLMRGELKPAHSLALYFDTKQTRYSDLEKDEAIKFLAKQNLNPNLYCDGMSLVRYKNLGLGWAKGLGKRVNNLYPQNWRIINF